MFNAVGRPHNITGNEKLAQDVGDTLLTDYDPVRARGSEVRALTKTMAQPQVITTMGDAFLARVIQDSMRRLASFQSSNPKYAPSERIVANATTVDIRHPSRKSVLFLTTVTPEAGDAVATGYRVRLRHQYPGVDARSVFPAGIVTDDSVP